MNIYDLGAIMFILTKVILRKVLQVVVGFLLRILDIKYYTKTRTSVFWTGYGKNYKLPPIYGNKVSVV